MKMKEEEEEEEDVPARKALSPHGGRRKTGVSARFAWLNERPE